MHKKILFVSFILASVLCSCAMMQSIVKSTFPYTANLVIGKSSPVGVEQSVTAMATSFDQDFSKNGNNGDKISEVRVVSAKLQSKDPSDFNIGNLKTVKFYMSEPDGSDEVMVASRTDITKEVGNSIVLDIDNSEFLDKLVREPQIKIRMAYKLRNKIDTTVTLHLVLGLGAYPNR
jgi:hypothetical protein